MNKSNPSQKFLPHIPSYRILSFYSLGLTFYTEIFNLFGDIFSVCVRYMLTVILLSMDIQFSCPAITEHAVFLLACILGVYVISTHWDLRCLEYYLLPHAFFVNFWINIHSSQCFKHVFPKPSFLHVIIINQ